MVRVIHDRAKNIEDKAGHISKLLIRGGKVTVGDEGERTEKVEYLVRGSGGR